IYEAMLPALERMSNAFLGVIQWLNGLSPEMKQLGVVIGVVAAAIGPLLALGGTLLIWFNCLSNFIAVLISIIKGVGSARTLFIGAVVWTVVAIAALCAAFVIAYNKSETVRDFIDGFKDKFVGAWESVMEFKDKVVTAFEAFFAIFKGDEAGGINMLESLGLTDDQIGMITGEIDSIKEQFNVMKDAISQALSTVKDFFIKQFEGVKSWWDSDGAMILSAISTTFEWTMDAIRDAVKFGLDLVVSLFKTFAPIVEGIWNILWPTIVYLTKTAWEKIKLVVGIAMDLVKGIISGVAAIIEGDWKRFGEILKETALSIKDRVVEHFGNLK